MHRGKTYLCIYRHNFFDLIVFFSFMSRFRKFMFRKINKNATNLFLRGLDLHNALKSSCPCEKPQGQEQLIFL